LKNCGRIVDFQLFLNILTLFFAWNILNFAQVDKKRISNQSLQCKKELHERKSRSENVFILSIENCGAIVDF